MKWQSRDSSSMRLRGLALSWLLVAGSSPGAASCAPPDESQHGLPGEAVLCSKQNPCPVGQFCINGACAIGCLSNGDCAADQYCDTEWSSACQNKSIPACPETPCASNQRCINSMCSTVPDEPQSCTPALGASDGCDEASICFDLAAVDYAHDYQCVAFPPCPEDGVCPVGVQGSACNDGYLPTKGRICLTGLCAGADNCPAGAACIKQGASPLGMCSDGTLGTSCLTDQDCDAASGLGCAVAMAGTMGTCLPGAIGCQTAGGLCVDMFDECPDETEWDQDKSCGGASEMCCI